jgi:dihydroxyacetone kinase-like predicted kinase
VLEPTDAASRTVVAVVAGPGLARAASAAGAVPVLVDAARPVLDALVEVLGRVRGDVVVLPNDMEALEAAHHLAARRRAEPRPIRPQRRMAVIPTVAQVQGLAALAVHDPEADFDTAVAAMSSAAGHARHGAVTVAETDTRTMAGRSVPGEVLGVVEGDFVEVGDRLVEVAWLVVRRLLAGGGELLTLVLGADAAPALADELTGRAREQVAGLEVQVIDGGQARYLLLVGVE